MAKKKATNKVASKIKLNPKGILGGFAKRQKKQKDILNKIFDNKK
jgi:hypothetical protein